MNIISNGHGHLPHGDPRPDCRFWHLFGNTILGRLLSNKVCDLDRDGGHYGVCEAITNPSAHAWAFAWGMAFALSKPEWAFEVLSEFYPEWQDQAAQDDWLAQIEEFVRRFPVERYL